jgi:hypothetical protein
VRFQIVMAGSMKMTFYSAVRLDRLKKYQRKFSVHISSLIHEQSITVLNNYKAKAVPLHAMKALGGEKV